MTDEEFTRLMAVHGAAVRSYANSMTKNSMLADDVIQETFVRAWKYSDSFRNDGSFEGWLIRICRNALFDATRKWQRDEPREDIDGSCGADESPELLLVVKELPPLFREVVVVCGILGYDYETAAQILGLPIGTIRSRLSRGRQMLTERLTDSEADSA